MGISIASIVLSVVAILVSIFGIVLPYFYKMSNRFSKKNFEAKRNRRTVLYPNDIVFTNLRETDVVIANIFFILKNSVHYIYDDEIVCDKNADGHYVVKPMQCISIKSVMQTILPYIVPDDDYLEPNNIQRDSLFFDNSYNVLYKKNYSKSKISFGIIDTLGKTVLCKSRYSITHYLKKYDKENMVSPHQIARLKDYAYIKKQNCIFTTAGRDRFDIFAIEDDNHFYSVVDKVNVLSTCTSDFPQTSYTIGIITKDRNTTYFRFFHRGDFITVMRMAEQLGIKKSIYEIALKEIKDLYVIDKHVYSIPKKHLDCDEI